MKDNQFNSFDFPYKLSFHTLLKGEYVQAKYEAGSGVDKIMSGWKESHWRRPFLEIERQPDRLKLTLPMFRVIPDAVLNALKDVFDDVSNLTGDELTVLSFCQIEGSISNQRLQYVLNLHSSDITDLLKKLCSEEYLESDNNGRWTIYKLKVRERITRKKEKNKSWHPTESEKADAIKFKMVDQDVDTKKDATGKRKVATSGEDTVYQEHNTKKVATSQKKVATSGKKVATSEKQEQSGKSRSMKRNELEEAILRLCKNDYIKKEELATQLGKSEDYIRNKILPELLKAGKLAKRFPFTHNHPEQGYKTTEQYAKEL